MVELMIALLLVSSLGLGISIYLQRSSQSLRTSEEGGDIEQSSLLLSRMLSSDIRQAVYLNPSCVGNAATDEVSTNCADIPFRGGIVPLPGLNMESLSSLANVQLPPTLEANASSLTSPQDGLRILLFDFDQDFHCPLDRTLAVNPEPTQQRLFVPTTCNQLEVGGLYVIVEEHGSLSFSNLLQVTALSVGGTNIEVEHSNAGANLYNQVGSLVNSGFTRNARLYPVFVVEYALDEQQNTGLYRREIRPHPGDLSGFGEWQPVDALVESIQFTYVSVLSNGTAQTHLRTMQFTADVGNNGVEDIRGVQPRIIFRSQRSTEGGQLFANPMIPGSPQDSFPRKDHNFFVALQNFEL